MWLSHYKCLKVRESATRVQFFSNMADTLSDGTRRRVSYVQLETLWDFLNAHKDVALGYNKSAQARDKSKRMWQMVTETLNSQGDGAVKDWRGWAKYWVDYKAKLKKRASRLRSSHHQTGGGRATEPPLSEIENKFLMIVGTDFGQGNPGVQVDPLVPASLEISIPDEARSPSARIDVAVPSGSRHTEGSEGGEEGSSNGEGEGVPGSLGGGGSVGGGGAVVVSDEVPSQTGARGRRGVIGSRGRQRAGPQRRQRRPVLTAEDARRSLIEISRARAETERRNSATLLALVNVLTNIYQLLLER